MGTLLQLSCMSLFLDCQIGNTDPCVPGPDPQGLWSKFWNWEVWEFKPLSWAVPPSRASTMSIKDTFQCPMFRSDSSLALLLGTLFMFLEIEVLTRTLDGPLAAWRRKMAIMCVFHVLWCGLTLSLSLIAFECVSSGLLRPRSCHRKTGYFSFFCPICMLSVSP